MKRSALLFLLLAPLQTLAQLTLDQKIKDFEFLANAFAKNYAPYEWKRQVFGFDLYNVEPWLARVRQSKDDLEFYDICSEYVASFRDAHSLYVLPVVFSANLGFKVDIYDGKVLVDSIDRAVLPTTDYTFQVGDELVSIDGIDIEALIRQFGRYAFASNPRSERRTAAMQAVSRSQRWIPRAHEIGETAAVAIRRNSGELQTYTIRWNKTGTPFTAAAPLPSPKFQTRSVAVAPPVFEGTPDYMIPLAELQNEKVDQFNDVIGVGERDQIFALPPGFEQRLGRATSDVFISGRYESEGLRIGYIRIGNFSPPSTAEGLRQFETEMVWFQENTDGLIVDIIRNYGGNACYSDAIQRLLIPYEFRALGRELRVTMRWVNLYSQLVEIAKAQRAAADVIARLEALLAEIQRGYSENRSRSGPLPICSDSLQLQPHPRAYKKPVMVLIDEFSASAAEGFAASMQDANRGPMFGYRTMGAGGTNGIFLPGGVYTETIILLTAGMFHRKEPVATSDYPTAHYVENIGVRPDIEYDYMTRDNLMQAGRPFVEAFTKAMVDHIRSAPQ